MRVLSCKIKDWYTKRVGALRMKIAYCFHGHMRTFERASKTFFQNIFEVCHGDIYIHTWDTITQRDGTWWRGPAKPEPVDEKRIRDVYNPKKLLIETQPSKISSHINRVPIDDSINYDAGSTAKAFWLAKKSGIKYDKYFLLRPDVFFLNKMPEREIMDMDHYYVNRHDHFIMRNCVGCSIWCHGDEDFALYFTNFYFFSQKYLLHPMVEDNYAEKCGEFYSGKYFEANKEIFDKIKLSSVKFAFLRNKHKSIRKDIHLDGGEIQNFSQEIGELHIYNKLKAYKGCKVAQFGASPGYGSEHLRLLLKSSIKPIYVFDNFKSGSLDGFQVINPRSVHLDSDVVIFLAIQVPEWKAAVREQIGKMWPKNKVIEIGDLT
jgi:hypothetical protein